MLSKKQKKKTNPSLKDKCIKLAEAINAGLFPFWDKWKGTQEGEISLEFIQTTHDILVSQIYDPNNQKLTKVILDQYFAIFEKVSDRGFISSSSMQAIMMQYVKDLKGDVGPKGPEKSETMSLGDKHTD